MYMLTVNKYIRKLIQFDSRLCLYFSSLCPDFFRRYDATLCFKQEVFTVADRAFKVFGTFLKSGNTYNRVIIGTVLSLLCEQVMEQTRNSNSWLTAQVYLSPSFNIY